MRSVEISAPTLEEARNAAAFQLGVSEDAMEIEVIEEPHKILGLIGSGHYRIRATYSEETAAAPEISTPEPQPEPDVEAAEEPTQAPPAAPSEELMAQPEELHALRPPVPPSEQPAEPKQAVAERAKRITEDVGELMGIPVTVTIRQVSEDEVWLEIEAGESAGLLIGQQGATLDALQLIVAIGANRGIADGCRVILDIEDYRARHEEGLRRQAQEAAEQAKRTGQEVVIPDLRSYERRVMHMELRDDPEVETYSEGDERNRLLVISSVSSEQQLGPSADLASDN